MTIIPQSSIIRQNDKPQPNDAGDLALQSASLGNAAHIAAANEIRIKKFKLLGYAQYLLKKRNVKNSRGTQPHRTSFCCWMKTHTAENVVIRLSTNDINSEASIGRVQTCRSIWACPVCAPRLATEKGKEIQQAIAWGDANDLIPVMVTLTARHNYRMPLKSFKTAFKAAWSHFTNRRAWRAFKENFGVIHHVANREITYGKSGWHYHMHFLIWMERRAIALAGGQGVEKVLTPDWLDALRREGLSGLDDVALKVTAHGNVGEKYLTKLGLTVSSDDDDLHYELTGTMNKKDSRTIWDILRHASYGDKESARLYIEFVEAMQGDNFLTWSHDFHDIVQAWAEQNIESEEKPEKMPVWAHISNEAWAWVVQANAIPEVLDNAARFRSIPKLMELLETIRDELQAAKKEKLE